MLFIGDWWLGCLFPGDWWLAILFLGDWWLENLFLGDGYFGVVFPGRLKVDADNADDDADDDDGRVGIWKAPLPVGTAELKTWSGTYVRFRSE